MNEGFKTSVEEGAAANVEITKELGGKGACDGNCSRWRFCSRCGDDTRGSECHISLAGNVMGEWRG